MQALLSKEVRMIGGKEDDRPNSKQSTKKKDQGATLPMKAELEKQKGGAA